MPATKKRLTSKILKSIVRCYFSFMPQLYIFILALLTIAVIIFRRDFVVKREQKTEFKKQVTLKLVAFKKEEADSVVPTRFRDSHSEERKKQKFDFAKHKELVRKADVAINKEHWQEAKQFLIQSLAETSKELPVYLKLGKIYMESGDLKKAETLYMRLREIDPDNASVHEQLAKIYTKKKRYKEAISHYVKAVELDEASDETLFHLGKLYQLLMRYSLAAECFRRAAEKKPRNVDYLFLLAEACAEDDDYDNALFTYEKILTLEPYNERAETASQEVRMKMKETEIVISNITTHQHNGKTKEPESEITVEI